MSYDYRYLQSKHPYNPIQIEKVCRISDTLERITQVPYLQERLSLYGGTALNFIHFPEIPRLSVDIDFNYRHQGEETDWGEIRKRIDENLKEILHSMGYKDQDIKIDASYPLSRFTVKYQNHLEGQDSFKIETGYINRIPILHKDTHLDFYHVGKETSFKVKTPKHEEIYANKIVTMLDRATPRDLFDVHSISKTSPTMNKLVTCSIIESMISLNTPLTKINPIEIVQSIPFDQRIQSVTKQPEDTDIDEIRAEAVNLVKKVTERITEKEKECIRLFYDERQFKPELLDQTMINPEIRSHPGILWALKKMEQDTRPA